MKLTSKTFPEVAPWGNQPPCMSVYQNCIRFNKRAAAMLGLPDASVSFDFEEMTIAKDPEGFQVKISGSWMDHVIHYRSLTRFVLERLGKKKAIFRIKDTGKPEQFSLKPEAEDFLYTHHDQDEERTMLQSGIVVLLVACLMLGGCNQKLYDGMSKRKVNTEAGR